MHIIPPPVIPEDAPFSETQRMWLKGFFDGLSALATEGVAPANSGKIIHILWGSQTGGAEGLAKKIAKKIQAHGHSVHVQDLGDVTIEMLTSITCSVLITSTYGDGEPPDNAKEFHQALMSTDSLDLSALQFAVYALGDSSYPDFCKCGQDFDQRLVELGATRIIERVDCDVDYDAPLSQWLARLCELIAA